MIRIHLNEYKYTVLLNAEPGNFVFKALRYGEDWRSLIGDNLVMAMTYEIDELQQKVKAYEGILRMLEGGKADVSDITAEAIKALGEYSPHRSCPNCREDCMGWIVEGIPCR